MSIAPLGPSPRIPDRLPTKPLATTDETRQTFGQTVARLVGQVNDLQVLADDEIQQLANGRTENVHDVVLAMAQADLSFRMLLEIRNRLIDAYQELMRMQV